MKMRVLLINRNHFVDGGADRVYINTGELLEKNNYEVAYFSSLDEKNLKTKFQKYFIRKIQTRYSSIFSKIKSVKKYLFNKDAAANLSQLIKDFNPDIAHVHLFYGILSPSILKVLQKYSIPVVITIHDYRLICPVSSMLDTNGVICEKCVGENYFNCIGKRCSEGNIFQSTIVAAEAYFRKYYIQPLKYINKFIFVSNFSYSKHLAFNPDFQFKSTHLYNFSKTTVNSITVKGDYFFYFGRLSKEKGIISLINAFKHTNLTLVIAGDGPYKNLILHEIASFDNIHFEGFKFGSELQKLILESSFVVVPSEWFENNPMTIIESFTLGKPVIASAIGGIPELVTTGTGLVFEPGNVKDLIDKINIANEMSVDSYINMSKNCINFALNNFNEDVHLNKLIGIYKDLINENSSK
jgi:glycosyltransferase involved in cell wall biosynthesis